MMKSRGSWLAVGLAVGFVVGLNVGGYWPQIPIHASATHGQDNFAICTGSIDPEMEAVFLLDFITGDLRAAVLSVNTRTFMTFFARNISKDFTDGKGAEVKNPKYLMVTGFADMRRQTNIPVGQAVVYIAEMNSGQLACYGLPWNPARQSQAGQLMMEFLPLDKFKFRQQIIRGQD